MTGIHRDWDSLEKSVKTSNFPKICTMYWDRKTTSLILKTCVLRSYPGPFYPSQMILGCHQGNNHYHTVISAPVWGSTLPVNSQP